MASNGNNPFETELLTQQYTTVLDLLLQQRESKLRGLVGSGSYVGKQASPVQQIGVVQFRQPGGRYSPIQFQNPNYTRRWVAPTDRDCGVPVDTFDELRTIVDPKAGINLAVVAAANRFADDVLISAAHGTAKTGVDSGNLSSESWDTTFDVADTFGSASSTGLTYRKLIEAKRILRHYQNDFEMEDATVIMGSQQESDLLTQQEVINKDYNDRPVVENGTISRIAGLNCVVSERVKSVSSDTIREVIVTMRSGMHLGIWKDMTIKVSQRDDLVGQPWQLYSMLSMGGTRLQLGKVIKVKCADTTGSDPTAP